MKVMIGCTECGKEGPGKLTLEYIEQRDDGYYEATCARGHKRALYVTVPKHELLFDSGSFALLDGYPRESVASIAAALERFYERFAKAVLLAQGVSHDQLTLAWNAVAKQSERQLGFYRAAYASQLKKAAPLLANKWAEFRNDVIHRGRFPSTQEATDYARAVIEHLAPLAIELSDSCAAGLTALSGIEMTAPYNAAKAKGLGLSTMAHSTLISDVVGSKGQVSFDEALIELAQRKTFFFSEERWGPNVCGH